MDFVEPGFTDDGLFRVVTEHLGMGDFERDFALREAVDRMKNRTRGATSDLTTDLIALIESGWECCRSRRHDGKAPAGCGGQGSTSCRIIGRLCHSSAAQQMPA